MVYFYIFLAALLIILASVVGVFFASKKFIKFFNQYNKRFVAFSTGVFLMMVITVLNEVMEHSNNYWLIGSMIILGFAFSSLLDFFLPETHQHYDDNCQYTKDKQLAKRVIVGDAIHNITDGIIIVPAFFVSPFLGFVTALSIFIHEVLQEISEFFVLKKAGYSNKKALTQNFLASLTILIGIGIGFLSKDNQLIELILLTFSSGMFVNVILRDLIPDIYQKGLVKQSFANLLIVGLGVGLLLAVGALAPHTHQHESNYDHHVDSNHHHEGEYEEHHHKHDEQHHHD